MADFSFSDDLELQKLNAAVLEDSEDYDRWEKLVQAAEQQEGRLNRNSSPGAIASTREVYDKFLGRFPLFFGYWKKYADLEFTIAGPEAAEMVYERGIASITTSVDLWASYCAFKVETSHDADVIRELFERGAESVGIDFHAHPFWDKYIEFEERVEQPNRIFAILERLIHIPLHQYARYFERHRSMAASRPPGVLLSGDVLQGLKSAIMEESGGKPKNEREFEAELRSRVENFYMEFFYRTQTETNKRWTYEQDVKRPYFHVTELDEPQLTNWRKYLDFEEGEGDYARSKFLYERCLVSCAKYDEFWLRYARWMLAQGGKEEEVRNIYLRATFYVPIAFPTVRLHYTWFEESQGRADVAVAIHEAMLMNLPGHVETTVSLANLHRRQYGLASAIRVLKQYIDDPETPAFSAAALTAEWARMVWQVKGSPQESRQIFQSNQKRFLDSAAFWTRFLDFEISQPTSENEEPARYKRVKSVYDEVRGNPQLPPTVVNELTARYFSYLTERGSKDAAAEFVALDREMRGPVSVQGGAKRSLDAQPDNIAMQKRTMLENGNATASQ